MKDTILFLGVFAAWLVLGRWVLPAIGIPTCMSGNCAIRPATTSAAPAETHNDTEIVEPKGDPS